MLDVNFIRQNPEKVREGIAKKNFDPKLVDKFLRLDEGWRQKIAALNQLKADQNLISKELARNKSPDQLGKAQVLKQRIIDVEEEKNVFEKKRNDILAKMPNLPLADVPEGKSEKENKVVREVGKKPEFSAKGGFEPKDHLELGEKLDLIDVERAAKVSGTRFGYLKNEAVLLEFALIEFGLKTLLAEGFVPVLPPVMIKEKMMKAMGYVDRREDRDETYFFEKDGLYLVGTAEQSIGPMHADEIFKEKELPKRYVAFSSCFRREAGSYGKDTRGIFRVHQFDKLEMFSFTTPEKSKQEHEFLLSLEEKMMQALELPYRVVQMCTGDLGMVAASKFDIEAWLPGQKEYRETHSTSNVVDFQARRLNIKYKPDANGAKIEYIHTLNGTAFAMGRTIIAILENYQTKDGKVVVPKVLQKYVGKKIIG